MDFSVHEMEDMGGSVPSGLAVELTASTMRLRGTDHSPPRCAALTGRVGQKASCGIYEWRPSPCREFEDGSDACQRARPAPVAATRRRGVNTAPKLQT